MATVITINGVIIDRKTCSLTGGDLYGKGVVPNFRVAVKGGALADLPNWNNATFAVEEAGVLIFAGRTGNALTHHDASQFGWVREWTAQGLIARGYKVPVTDSNSLTDVVVFNQSPEEGPAYIPSRAGRSVGQIAVDVLEMHAPALAAKGVGNFTSAGTGANAVAVMSGGSVGSATVTGGGSGYTVAPTVFFCGGSGSGATGTATVSGGVVTGISVTNAGSGYWTTPTIVLSTLPATTLADLDRYGVIPPQRFTVSGESVLQSLESSINAYYPNDWMGVDPNADIRFRDPRLYSADITLELDGSDPRPKPTLNRDWSGCFANVEVRGNTQIAGQYSGLAPRPGSGLTDGGLQEDFSHDGLSNAQAKTAFRASDWTQPGQSFGQATASSSISAGVLSTVSAGNQGYGYTTAPTVLVSGGGGTGATVTATLTGDKVTSYTVTNGGSSYTSAPTISVGAPGVGQTVLGTCTMSSTTSVTITSADPRVQWPANYWDQTSSGHLGWIQLAEDSVSSITQYHNARIIANTSMSPGGTCDLTIDNPAPATTYTSFLILGTGAGAGPVYRRYKLTNTALAKRIQQQFPFGVPYFPGDTPAAINVTSPQARVFLNGQQLEAKIGSIDPDAGTITLLKPTALMFSNAVPPAILPVDDVVVFLPVATGILRAVWPPDSAGVPQFAGTAYDEEGIDDTKTVTARQWRDYGNTASMTAWAKELHGSLSDTVLEGDVDYLGLLVDALTPGHSVNIPGNGYVTGLEAINLPIARCSIAYHEGRSAVSYTTSMSLSNRRALYSGERFERPQQTGLPFGLPEGGSLPTATGSENTEAYGRAGAAKQRGDSGANYGESPVKAPGLDAPDLSGIPTDPGSYFQSNGISTDPSDFFD